MLPRGSPNATLVRRNVNAPKASSSPNTSDDRQQRLPREGRTHDQKLAHEDAERRQSGDRDDADHETPAKRRMGHRQAADPR